jgi:general transcription factor 3C polypeptide 1
VKLIFYAEPNVSFDMRLWRSIIEEQKIQNFLSNTPHESIDLGRSSVVSFMSKTSVASEEFGPQSKQFENFPKFMKLKLFHEFLFYLIYAYPNDHKKIPIRRAIEVWRRENPKILDYDEITEKIVNCYSTEINWKMFVSPLNPQRDYENGWGFLRDIIHRIPLILFVKFYRVANSVSEISEYLNHPIKCNYLLHFLPANLRDKLLHGRKHVFVVQELCKRLCWAGLLQFGPMRTKEIDQSFVYLNRNASLVDTTSSDAGYLEVSEQEYPELSFHFDSSDKIIEYWNKMFEIAINTKLDKKSTAIGKTVEIEQMSSKADLQDALKVQTPISAPLNDLGEIPGDHKGACGLDKTFLVHLKRNWTRPIAGEKRVRSFKSAKIPIKKKKERSSVVKEAAAKIKNKIRARRNTGSVATKSKVIRKIQAVNRSKIKPAAVQDSVDKEALKMMKTMRVTWTEVEDKTLLLTRVATKFAFPQDAQSSYYVSPNVIRDILHWRTEKALNKTSKACSRRILYMMKTKPNIKETIALHHEFLRTNREFTMKYRNLAERLKKIYPMEEIYNAVKIHIVEMVFKMHQILYKQYLGNEPEPTAEEESFKLPNDYNEIVENFLISNPADTLTTPKYFDPETTKEAEICVLMTMIHSDVCCNRDKTSYTAHQYEVYRKFPDSSIGAAVSKLKKASVITANKNHKNKLIQYSYSTYHLSTRYAAQFMSIHVPVELYGEYLNGIKTLSDTNGLHQMTSLSCGWIFMLAELISSGKIKISYESPTSLVMVDPAIRKRSQFDKISDNYMKSMKSDAKKTVKFDENGDDSFLYQEDPIEIFLKLDQFYLHGFCILHELLSKEKVEFDGECESENCALKDEENFDKNIQKIACETREMLNEMLENSVNPVSQVSQRYSDNPVSRVSQRYSDNDEKKITKQNFIAKFNEIIEKQRNEEDEKDVGKKARKFSSEIFIEEVLRLANEPGLDEDSWLSDYKKISRKADEYDDEMDLTGDHIKHSKMLHQLKDLNVNTTRTSDSFVVNLSTIYVDVAERSGEKLSIDSAEIEASLLPFDEEKRAKFLNKIVDEAKWNPEDLQPKDIFDELKIFSITNTIEIMQISEILNFLQSKSQMGAKPEELVEMFIDKRRLQRQIGLLIEMKFVLRVGVVETRFVHRDFAFCWLIDTFCLARDDDESNKRKADGNDAEEPAAKKAKIDETNSIDLDTMPKPKKPPTRIPFRVHPAPWIRINGTLNRRVIDKWLGTILNHLTINPGILLTDLSKKFNILTPFDVRRLCETLEMIQCVKLMTVNEAEVNLFSSYSTTTVDQATFFCSAEKIFIELAENSMQQLAFFIGRQRYKNPFI